MTGKSETDGSLESRIEELEDQIGEGSIEDIQTHIDQIEHKQEELQHDLEGIVESFRKEGDNIPHIDSVKAIYNRLEDLEQNISNLQKLVDDVANEENDS